MKQITKRSVREKGLLVWLTGLCLLLIVASPLWAQESDAMSAEVFQDVVIGPFDGLDLKQRFIWINDTVYALDRTVKIKGTSTKLGLLSDLKAGEELKATLAPNEKTPSIPYVLMIERR